jgi:TM2 domain-containing membrane protein YozV
MNCANHPDVSAAAFCRECGKPMCQECQRPALGSIYCAEHLPAAAAAVPPIPSHVAPSPYTSSPYTAPVFDHPAMDPSVHPVLALILGFLPGVGAIYNGQYAKGLIHAVIFGLLVSIADNVHRGWLEGFIGIMIGVWVIYQAFEAYHTARKRRYGIAVEEFSSLFEIRPAHGKFPVGAIVLIGAGFILLLDNTGIIRLRQFERYWPALLIVAGLYLLYARLSPGRHNSGSVKGEAQR